MANINDVFPSKFLKVADLQGTEPTVTIARVEFEEVGQGHKRETVPVLYFVGKAKGLKLNKTMGLKMAALTGANDTDHWRGRRVTLYASEATFGADTFDVVRIKAARVVNGAARVAAPPPPPPPPPPPDPDADGDAHESYPLTDADIQF